MDALNAAGTSLFRIGAISNGSDLLANDLGLDTITDINGTPIQEGVFFAGDNGGAFRVFDSGVVDFRHDGGLLSVGDTTSFTYTATDGVSSDTATVSVTVGASVPLTEDDAYSVTSEALAFEGAGLFRIGALNQGTNLQANDGTDAAISAINTTDLFPNGEWFAGDNGGEFRVFARGVVDFRNQGSSTVAEGNVTGFDYTIIENGNVDTARVTLTVTADTGPAVDDVRMISGGDLAAAGSQYIRIGAVNDGSDLLENDIMVDEIVFVNGAAIDEGVWFDGSNGGQFRVFDRGVVDFRNQGDPALPGTATGFTYGVIEDGVFDIAEALLIIG